MHNRPASVTVVSLFIIVLSILGFIFSLMNCFNPLAQRLYADFIVPFSVFIIINMVGNTLQFFSGLLILKGDVMGRMIFFIWAMFSIVLSIFSLSSLKIINGSVSYFVSTFGSIAILLIFVMCLYSAKANIYFKAASKG